ncbi:hypothetical protein NDU88_006746 [Pleurodeles waltl]|uniref:Secreted protein n=1 Tax=Pleurodeles waltl TaxID=8319 RepID=A0AAV7X2E6_PLEWA|nr:hypothetical protein NDU88_006746 [Pleurodeles waltl]
MRCCYDASFCCCLVVAMRQRCDARQHALLRFLEAVTRVLLFVSKRVPWIWDQRQQEPQPSESRACQHLAARLESRTRIVKLRCMDREQGIKRKQYTR